MVVDLARRADFYANEDAQRVATIILLLGIPIGVLPALPVGAWLGLQAYKNNEQMRKSLPCKVSVIERVRTCVLDLYIFRQL